MVKLSSLQKKVLAIFNNEGVGKAWNYWKLMGNTYGIFLGEVPSNEFIDGETLANHIGLTEGVLCNVDTPWLKFLLDGNIIYVAMKPLMHSVSWTDINECGAVFENGGSSIIVGNNEYNITLLRGANVNTDATVIDGTGFDFPFTHISEWNRLMYPIHTGSYNPSIPYARWARYTDEDILAEYSGGDASLTWTQETLNDSASRSLVRGGIGVTYVSSFTSSNDGRVLGWRPTLRLL